MSENRPRPSPEEIAEFQRLIELHRYDYVTLAYLIFGFGEPGTEMEHIVPYDWQIRELQKISEHLQNPLTRYTTYRLIISSGNGAAKTAFGAMVMLIMLYTQKLRGRVTANTAPQLSQIVWPEYDIWFRRAKYHEEFFDKQGTSIKSLDEKYGESWRFDQFNWDISAPTRVSGLHNKGHAILYTFEEAPGIPAVIWQYANGAFSDVDTIKIWLAFGNSDDPESMFEQNMTNPEWRSVRIDTRTLTHVDQTFVASLLRECRGNEDADDFRVRVRGLPRKANKDAIINAEAVAEAFEAGERFDMDTVRFLPSVLTCDPAWTGGDEVTIWHHQGHAHTFLERLKLDKSRGEDHRLTYGRLKYWEHLLRADAVLLDQAEGTGIRSMAWGDQKYHWETISFASSPNDQADPKDSEYANIRAQMYYECGKDLNDGHVLRIYPSGDAEKDYKNMQDVSKQLCWTKRDQHAKSLKKLAESKKEIKLRVGQSPDLSDGCVLGWARKILTRLPHNQGKTDPESTIGSDAYSMPSSTPEDIYEIQYSTNY